MLIGKLGFANGRSFSKITHVAKLPLELPESSGLIYSKKDGMLISNNDSGNKSELISFRPNGDLVNIQSFETLKNIDWEDLTQDDQGNVYIGDFGNNRQMRKDLKIYKIGQSEEGKEAVDIVVEAMFSGQELEEVPKVFKKFSIEEFSTYMGLIFAYGFGCSGMFN